MTNPSQPRVNPRSPTMPPAGLPQATNTTGGGQLLVLVLSWAGVGLPLAWGVMETLRKTMALFQ